jgi:methane/ammonia monooxygenase subunit A
MFRTDEIIKAAKLPPEGVAMSRHIDYIYFIPILFVTIIGTFHMHFDLLAGDWDFWLDWKDRQWWVVVTPVTAITFVAALQYYNWVNYRQPFGATITILALLAGKWVTVVAAWWWWSNYPYNFVMPATLLPSALVIDIILLLTRSWVITAVVGAWLFAALFYPTNWALFGYSKTPIVVDGTLLSWADYMGFVYVRTGTPEYIRLIEVGSLRTFGGHSTMISAFFASFASSLMYILWWQFGKFFCTSYFYLTDDRGRTTKVHDVLAYGELARAERIKMGGSAANVGGKA